ncbi:MAG: hypothetical protein WBR21_05640 [Rouxiella badensis]|uniref:hypothetical protein n=1 Tax=Rouxiella badensis TaxID=1646377 RepID=UPI003C42FA43
MKVLLATTCLLLLATSTVQASEWKKSWAQGVTEYRLQGEGQSSLYFGCDPNANTFVQVTDAQGKSISSLDEGRSVYASVDGKPSLLINDTFSDAGSSAFVQLWKQLRVGKNVVLTADNLQSTRLTLSGAAHVLPKLDASDCRVMQ